MKNLPNLRDTESRRKSIIENTAAIFPIIENQDAIGMQPLYEVEVLRRMMKRLVPIAISILIGVVALYAGLQHNAMGEFCRNDNLDVCDIDYLYALGIFLSWFIVSLLVQIFVILTARGLHRRIKASKQ